MTFKDFIGSGSTGIIGVLNTIVVPLIFSFAALAFVWGVINYFFLHGSDETKREEGRSGEVHPLGYRWARRTFLRLGLRKLIVVHAWYRAERVICHTSGI